MQNNGLQVSLQDYQTDAISLLKWVVETFCCVLTKEIVLSLYSKYRYEAQKKKREAQKKAIGNFSLLSLLIANGSIFLVIILGFHVCS